MRERARDGRLWFAIATVAALLAVGATFATRPDAVGVVVAARDLAAGTVIDGADKGAVTRIDVGGANALGGMVSDPAALTGRRLAVAVRAGEPVTEALLGGGGTWRLRPGERAMPVPAAALDALGLGVGDRVDVLSSATPDAPAPRIVASDAEVLDLAPSGDGAGEVVLRVAERDALAIAGALGVARDVRLLRRPARSGGGG